MPDYYTPWEPLEEKRVPEAMQDAHDAIGAPEKIRVFANTLYEVIAVQEGTTLIHLSLKRYDRQAITNWRHMQQMKNEVCGEEAEGLQLFPAESRLVDNANQYHLWVVPGPDAEDFGWRSMGENDQDIIPLPRDGHRPMIGWDERMVTADEDVRDYNALPGPGRQEPWQPGLTTGRTIEQTDEERAKVRSGIDIVGGL